MEHQTDNAPIECTSNGKVPILLSENVSQYFMGKWEHKSRPQTQLEREKSSFASSFRQFDVLDLANPWTYERIV